MLEQPLVTVLMSVYNGEKYLNEAIESILNQTFSDFEFLIINDGSIDSSADIIASHVDPRIRLINNKSNIGLTRSLNMGIELARGKYIARMDGDDISLPERLEKQVEFMEENDDIVVCGTKGLLINAFNEELEEISPLAFNPDEIKVKLLIMNQFIHPSVIMRKQVIKKVGGYSTRFKYAQDYHLWINIASNNYKMANLNQILIKYRSHDNSISIKAKKEQERVACKVIKQGFKVLYGKKISLKDAIVFRSILLNNANGISPKRKKRVMGIFDSLINNE